MWINDLRSLSCEMNEKGDGDHIKAVAQTVIFIVKYFVYSIVFVYDFSQSEDFTARNYFTIY